MEKKDGMYDAIAVYDDGDYVDDDDDDDDDDNDDDDDDDFNDE